MNLQKLQDLVKFMMKYSQKHLLHQIKFKELFYVLVKFIMMLLKKEKNLNKMY
jgi:hypothetical protein